MADSDILYSRYVEAVEVTRSRYGENVDMKFVLKPLGSDEKREEGVALGTVVSVLNSRLSATAAQHVREDGYAEIVVDTYPVHLAEDFLTGGRIQNLAVFDYPTEAEALVAEVKELADFEKRTRQAFSSTRTDIQAGGWYQGSRRESNNVYVVVIDPNGADIDNLMRGLEALGVAPTLRQGANPEIEIGFNFEADLDNFIREARLKGLNIDGSNKDLVKSQIKRHGRGIELHQAGEAERGAEKGGEDIAPTPSGTRAPSRASVLMDAAILGVSGVLASASEIFAGALSNLRRTGRTRSTIKAAPGESPPAEEELRAAVDETSTVITDEPLSVRSPETKHGASVSPHEWPVVEDEMVEEIIGGLMDDVERVGRESAPKPTALEVRAAPDRAGTEENLEQEREEEPTSQPVLKHNPNLDGATVHIRGGTGNEKPFVVVLDTGTEKQEDFAKAAQGYRAALDSAGIEKDPRNTKLIPKEHRITADFDDEEDARGLFLWLRRAGAEIRNPEREVAPEVDSGDTEIGSDPIMREPRPVPMGADALGRGVVHREPAVNQVHVDLSLGEHAARELARNIGEKLVVGGIRGIEVRILQRTNALRITFKGKNGAEQAEEMRNMIANIDNAKDILAAIDPDNIPLTQIRAGRKGLHPVTLNGDRMLFHPSNPEHANEVFIGAAHSMKKGGRMTKDEAREYGQQVREELDEYGLNDATVKVSKGRRVGGYYVRVTFATAEQAEAYRLTADAAKIPGSREAGGDAESINTAPQAGEIRRERVPITDRVTMPTRAARSETQIGGVWAGVEVASKATKVAGAVALLAGILSTTASIALPGALAAVAAYAMERHAISKSPGNSR